MSSPFSERHEISKESPEITIRYDAPDDLRYAVTEIVFDSDLGPKEIREIVCKTVMKRPDEERNWSDEYVKKEVQSLLRNCEWYHIYDVIEKVCDAAQFRNTRDGVNAAQYIEKETNKYFRENGIGWELVDGKIQHRGEESFQHIVAQASNALKEKGLETSHREIRAAIKALSQLLEPDLTGAIFHATNALEAVSGRVAEDDKSRLDNRLKEHIPKPLDTAVAKMWGYASENARHGKERRAVISAVTLAEAELFVGISSALCLYLTHKIGKDGG